MLTKCQIERSRDSFSIRDKLKVCETLREGLRLCWSSFAFLQKATAESPTPP